MINGKTFKSNHKKITEDDLRLVLDRFFPSGAIPLDLPAIIATVKKFPAKEQTIGLFVKEIGFVFATAKRKGVTAQNIFAFLSAKIYPEMEEEVYFIQVGEDSCEIFYKNNIFTVPFSSISPNVFQNLENFKTELSSENKIKTPIAEKINQSDKLDIQKIIKKPTINDIPAISNFANKIIHGQSEGIFDKEIWKEIGVGILNIVHEVIISRDAEKIQMTLELAARSLPFMDESEKILLVRELVGALTIDDNLSIELVDKISSILLVSSNTIDSNTMKIIIGDTFKNIDKRGAVSSNLAKLIRKFL